MPAPKDASSSSRARALKASGLLKFWPDMAALAWLGLLFFLLCRWSWRKWPDLYIDFGRELYQPWQIAQGKVLYRDLYLEYGPFSKYFNALLFELFGTSFQTLFTANLLLLAALALLLYRFIVEIADRWSAVAATTVLLGVFGFSQYVPIANYNFVAPYSHEATHGVILAFVMLYALWRNLQRLDSRWCALAGVCAGGILLTKPELGLAAGGAVAVFATALAFDRDTPAGSKWRTLAVFVGAVAVLPLGFLSYFLVHLPLGQALVATGGAWVPVFSDAGVGGRYFDLWVMGADDLGGNLQRLLSASLVYFTVLGGLFLLCRILARWETRGAKKTIAALILIGGGLAALTAYIARGIHWIDAFRPLPLLIACVGVIVAALYFGQKAQGWVTRPRLVILEAWAAFALLLMLKIALYARLYHYGFYLALPGTLLLIVAVVGLPRQSLPATAKISRCIWVVLMGVLVGFGIAGMLERSAFLYALKTYPIGRDGNLLLTFAPDVDPRSRALEAMLDHCAQNLPPDATLTCLPEGIMVNFLLGRENPSPAVVFGRGAVSLWGEGHLLETLQRRPPDFILLIHRDYSERGVGFFGVDPRNGKDLMSWVRAEYEPVASVGAEPFTSDLWGMILFQRKNEQ